MACFVRNTALGGGSSGLDFEEIWVNDNPRTAYTERIYIADTTTTYRNGLGIGDLDLSIYSRILADIRRGDTSRLIEMYPVTYSGKQAKFGVGAGTASDGIERMLMIYQTYQTQQWAFLTGNGGQGTNFSYCLPLALYGVR